MSPNPTLLSVALLVAGLAAASASAQGGDAKVRPPGVVKAATQQGGGDEGETIQNQGEMENQAIVPAGLEGRVGAPNSEQYFSVLGSVRPRRLAPGQSGTLHVVITLRGDVLVLPDHHIHLKVIQDDSPFVIGAPRLMPARKAEIAEKYRGQLVYDDSLEFEVPVTVVADAKAQKHFMRGHVELELTRASDGKPLGRVIGALSGIAKIGKPLPQPVLSSVHRARGAQLTGSGEAIGLEAQAAAGSAPVVGAVPAGGRDNAAARLEDSVDPSGAEGGADGASEMLEIGGDNSMLWGVGGLALALIAGLLLFRSRS